MERISILIFTNHFQPENFKVNEIAFDFAAKGYDVTVVTGIPNYPSGRIYKGYGFFSRRCETINGVNIVRLPLIPRGNGRSIRLAINYVSYFFSSCLYALYLACTKRFDIVFVHETSPVTIAVPGIIYKCFRKVPMLLWVLDLWPESVRSASNVKSNTLDKLITRLVKYIYNKSDKILISSNGFRQSILEKGDYDSKLFYFPNWAEDVIVNPHATSTKPPVELADALPGNLHIMYTGNMGDAQGFDTIMKAMLLLKEKKNIKWLLVGGGRKAEEINRFVQEHGLQEQVQSFGNHPVSAMPFFFSKATVMLLSLKDLPIFRLTVPAKLQAYMGFGKPILAVIKGEAEEIVMNAKCGVVCEPGNPSELARAVLEIATWMPEKQLEMSKNARAYYLANFEKELQLSNLDALFKDFIGRKKT